jgi:ferric-dicitrate binding protein FerR (iron transport regulator)
MQKEEFLKIVERISDGVASDQDIALYLKWYQQFDLDDRMWDQLQVKPEDFRQELLLNIQHEIQEDTPVVPIKKIQRIWPGMIAAASVILCLSVGVYFFKYKSSVPVHDKILVSNKINPGSNKAVLTLSDGKQIVLDDTQNGRIADQGDASIRKTAEGNLIYEVKGTDLSGEKAGKPVFNRMTTPRGGQYQLILPDGTKVFLNAASSLKYPTVFDQKERRVELTGEGYFEVAGNREKPFLVNVNGAHEIEVLGTHFNVKAYPDDKDIRTTLLEGSVKINYKDRHVLLKPKYVAVNDLKGNLLVKQANIEQVMAWKNGLFVFDNVNLKEAMNMAARWYDIEVDYRGNVAQKKLWGTVSKYKTITELLDKIKFTTGINYKIEGRRVILTD